MGREKGGEREADVSWEEESSIRTEFVRMMLL